MHCNKHPALEAIVHGMAGIHKGNLNLVQGLCRFWSH